MPQPLALIFDMDGTMVDSMPSHAQSWLVFAQRHGIDMDLGELMVRTTGRTGTECMGILLNRSLSAAQALPLVHEKETIYRELFAPIFSEVAGFKVFAEKAHQLGFKIGVGTAGDKDNIAFVMQHLQMAHAPLAIVGGDQGLPGKPEPAIFLEAAKRMDTPANRTIVFEDAPLGIEAARRAGMRAVAICTSHSAAELAGPHVIAAVRDFSALPPDFLDNLLKEEHYVS